MNVCNGNLWFWYHMLTLTLHTFMHIMNTLFIYVLIKAEILEASLLLQQHSYLSRSNWNTQPVEWHRKTLKTVACA